MSETPAKQFALASVFSVIPIPFVVLRLRARRQAKNPISWDDWLIILALVGAIALGILIIVGAAAGDLGGHTVVGPQGIVEGGRHAVFNQIEFGVDAGQQFALGPMKLSVLFFYRRVFRGTTFNATSWFLIAVTIAWMITFFFTNLLKCVPIEPSLGIPTEIARGDNCTAAKGDMWLARAYSDFLLDLLILVLPLPIIIKLHMPFTRKLQLLFVFLLGTMTLAASVARLAITYTETQLSNSGDLDESNFEAPVIYWPLIEASIGIVAACLLTLRPVVERWSVVGFVSSIKSFTRKISLSSHESDDAISLRSTPQGSGVPKEKMASHDTDVLPNHDLSFTPGNGYCQQTKIQGAPTDIHDEKRDVLDDGILVENSFSTAEERVSRVKSMDHLV